MARDFNGSSHNVNFGNVISITGAVITLHAWIKKDSVSGHDPIIAKMAAANNQYELYTNGTAAGIFAGNGNAVEGATALSTGTWYGITGVKNGGAGSTLKIYVNGVEDGTFTVVGNISGESSSLEIGHSGYGDWFDGHIAECAIWNTNLSVGEIESLGRGLSPAFVRPQSLQAYWPIYGTASPEPDFSSGQRHFSTSIPASDPPPIRRFFAPLDIANSGESHIHIDIAETVYIDIQVSGSDIEAMEDSATVYVNLQTSGLDAATYIDTGTVYVNIDASHCEWYIPRLRPIFTADHAVKWEAVAATKWSAEYNKKWDASVENVIHEPEEICT